MESQEINIRLAQPEELDKIIDLQTRSIRELSPQFRKYNEAQIQAIVLSQTQGRKVGDETIFLAETNNLLMGFVAISRYSIFNCSVSGIYVHPDFTGQGIGTLLLDTIERTSRHAGYKKISVLSSTEAVDFYYKNGYGFIRNDGFYAAGWIWIPCRLLEKELIPTTTKERHLQQLLIGLAIVSIAALIKSLAK